MHEQGQRGRQEGAVGVALGPAQPPDGDRQRRQQRGGQQQQPRPAQLREHLQVQRVGVGDDRRLFTLALPLEAIGPRSCPRRGVGPEHLERQRPVLDPSVRADLRQAVAPIARVRDRRGFDELPPLVVQACGEVGEDQYREDEQRADGGGAQEPGPPGPAAHRDSVDPAVGQ
jgi:hypothetical protein